jgi:hypothetical protein
MSRYLKHHGIKGQKWGVRRYQKADGTLTKAGQRRYAKDEARAREIERNSQQYLDKKGNLNGKGKSKFDSKKDMYDQLDDEISTNKLRRGKDAVDFTSKVANDLQRNLDNQTRAQQKAVDKYVQESVRERATKMSDKELRDAVNRLNMEENYTRMMSQRESVEVGRSKVEKFADVAASALTYTSTALTIALAIKELKG